MLSLMFALMIAEPYQGEIKERLAAPVVDSFTSNKPAFDLEICVADAVSVLGVPLVYRDGPDNLVMMVNMASGAAYLASVSFVKTETGTRLDLRLKGKGWNDRLSERITACVGPA